MTRNSFVLLCSLVFTASLNVALSVPSTASVFSPQARQTSEHQLSQTLLAQLPIGNKQAQETV